jgi:hypothetical protein
VKCYSYSKLEGRDMNIGCDPLSWFGRHLGEVILKSFNAWQCNSLYPNVYLQTFLVSMAWVPSNYKFDLDIWGRDMVLARDTSSWCGRYLYQVILKFFTLDKPTVRTRRCTFILLIYHLYKSPINWILYLFIRTWG